MAGTDGGAADSTPVTSTGAEGLLVHLGLRPALLELATIDELDGEVEAWLRKPAGAAAAST